MLIVDHSTFATQALFKTLRQYHNEIKSCKMEQKKEISMNAIQIHLALNHFPIAGLFFAFFVLIAGLSLNQTQIKIVGASLLIAAAITGIVVFKSGEEAEEKIEHQALASKSIIHEHEESAEAAMVGINLSAVLSVIWIILKLKNKSAEKSVFYSLLFINLVAIILIFRAAHSGGLIRHEELRNNSFIDSNLEKEQDDD